MGEEGIPSYKDELLRLAEKKIKHTAKYRVYKKKVDNFETALNLAKRLEV